MEDLVRAWLAEDVGAGDVTSRIVPREARARGTVVARQACVLAGTEPVDALWRQLECTTRWIGGNGGRIERDAAVLEVVGPARAVLEGERACLNTLMLACGVATLTREVVDRVQGVNARCRVLATRKTPPGLRALVHDAVRAGGGEPHRRGLDDAVLIKNNHVALVGSVGTAVRMARELGKDLRIAAEARTPQEAVQAAAAGADVVLLDNFDLDMLRDAAALVKQLRPDVLLEASGGLGADSAAAAAPHVDRVSLGALTRAPWVDLAMRVEPLG